MFSADAEMICERGEYCIADKEQKGDRHSRSSFFCLIYFIFYLTFTLFFISLYFLFHFCFI